MRSALLVLEVDSTDDMPEEDLRGILEGVVNEAVKPLDDESSLEAFKGRIYSYKFKIFFAG